MEISAEVPVDFLLDTVSLHGKEHHDGIVKPHFPVPCEIFSRVDRILAWIGGDLVDRHKQHSLDCVRMLHKYLLVVKSEQQYLHYKGRARYL